LYGVYLVDDEKLDIQDVMNSIPWPEHGFEVIGFNTSAQVALNEITAKKPDVVFCDLKMPVYDGIELVKRVRDSGVDTEFIMLSAYEEFDACRQFYRMDGFDYLCKPLDPSDAAIVLEALSRRLAAKHNLTPSVQFVPSQSTGFDDIVKYVTANFNKKHTLDGLSELYKRQSRVETQNRTSKSSKDEGTQAI
jgi:YesN/AraC family two-component response regulator